MHIATRALLGAAAIACLTPAPANAITFVLTDTGGAGAGTQARAGFEAAAFYWSQVLTDDITVNLDIGFSSLDPGVLGGATSERAVASVQGAYGALNADRTSALDNLAVATLRPLTPSAQFGGLGSLSVVANDFTNATLQGFGRVYSDQNVRLDADGSANNTFLAVNTANFKALGGVGLPADASDGSISFSSDFDFDFNPADGIAAGRIDFIGVALHEIGHVLGFVSGVDTYDFFTYNLPGGGLVPGGLEGFAVSSTLDLFRYGAPGVLDWSTIGEPKYFSIDGGTTQLFGDSRFATGAFNGDGAQASHWKDRGGCSGQIGIMDPNFCFGQEGDVTASDLAAFDAMGWDLGQNILLNPGYSATSTDAFRNYLAAIPEPSTWAMLIAGFGMVGFAMRRAQRRNTKREMALA